MKKVLVAVDGSDKSLAADYAISIANKERAQLIILNVLDMEPWFYGQSAYRWATEDELRKVYADEILEREKILAKIKEKLKRLTFSQRPKSPQTTSTAAAIVNYAEKEKVDLLTIGTRGRTGITRMLLGSVASAVVTYAHCPVMVVK